MEILSYEKVLKLLQEELSNKEFHNQSGPSKLNDYCDKQSEVQTLKDDWIQVATKINRMYKDSNSNLIQLIPCTANKFELLSNLKVNESTSAPITEKENLNKSGYQKTTRKTQLAKSGKKGKHKVLIIGDSHARKCVTNLQHNLGKNYKVTGFIKPGAQMREIINTAKEEISTVKKLVSSELAKIIGKLFHEICLDPIYMKWKDSTLKGDNPKMQDKTGITSVRALNMSAEDDLTESRNCVLDNTMIDNKIRVSEKPKKIPNIRSLRFKCNELICHLQNERTHILCFTEHHLDEDKLATLNIDNYQIGAHYSRNNYDKGVACIFVHNSLKFSAIDLDSYFIDKDIEACAIHLNSIWKRICILTVYRPPNDSYQYDRYEIFPVLNGLSDHEAQFLTLHLTPTTNKDNHTNFIRNINNSTVYDFQMKLSYENWEPIFNSDDVNASFNAFFNIFLRHFYSSFPLIQVHKFKPNLCFTPGILASCRHKRVLHLEVRKSNNPVLLKHYNDYCNILTKVINQAKRMNYAKQILNSTNRIRTMWKIINREIRKKVKKDSIQTICIDGRNTNNLYNIVEAFNSYFKTTADNICNKIKANIKPMSSTDNGEDYMAYMDKAFGSPFPKIQISKTMSVEIERIIKSLKSSYMYGYDEISNKILKACRTFISTPLSYLCNRVLFE
ncbi:hypothetical protein Cfor_03752, partial [Coptotermes formosanus]